MTKLLDLIITKVALVDEGSCSDAHIKLYKRKTQEGGSIMDFETIVKSLPEDQQTLVNEAITKAKAEVPEGLVPKTDLETAEAKALAAEGEVAKLKAQLEVKTENKSAEEILKSTDLDPAIRALLESNIAKTKAAEVAIQKMQENAEAVEFVAKAKEVAFVPEADVKVVELLKSVKSIDGAVDKVMDILKSVNVLIEKGNAFKEVGTGGTGATGSDADAAWATIEKTADSLVVKGNISKEKAIEMVMEQQPALYKTYVDALRS